VGVDMKNLDILIVEDESIVAMGLEDTLNELGYNVVDYATSVKMARKLLEDNDVNLILMDINLKDKINGIELYESLDNKIPVIYVSAYSDEEIVCKAVKTEPLGFITKPYSKVELDISLKLARYKLFNNDTLKDSERFIELGDNYRFNSEENKLYYKQHFIDLSEKELQLLRLLLDANGEPLTYKIIEDQIYGNNAVGGSTVRTLVYRLKGKLDYKFIKNEYKVGIKLELTS
jgi:DNA-binding response OmpR family regulator